MFSFVNFDSRKIWHKRQKNDRKPFNFRGKKAQQYSTHRHLGKVVYIYFEKMQTVAYSCFLTPDTSWSNSLGMSEFWWGLSNLERVKWKQKSYNHIFKGLFLLICEISSYMKRLDEIIARLSFCRCLQHKFTPHINWI